MKESDIRNRETFDRYLELAEEDCRSFFKYKKRLKTVVCVSCGSPRYKFQFAKSGFPYVLCDDCGTLYANPRPLSEDLLAFYKTSKSAAFWISDFFLPMIESRREKIFKPRAKLIAQKISARSINFLGDIGSGFGLFLEEMKKILPEVRYTAIEPSPDMAGICRGKGFETINKAIEDIKGIEGKFDFLSAFELLEHLYEPQALFRNAYRMLKPSGLLLATTLNCEGFDMQVLWERSKNIYPPQHINFFNPRSLKKALESNGFYVEEIITPGKLDWNIVENTVKDGIFQPERLWLNFSKNADLRTKEDFQDFLADHCLSSHMMALARKNK